MRKRVREGGMGGGSGVVVVVVQKKIKQGNKKKMLVKSGAEEGGQVAGKPQWDDREKRGRDGDLQRSQNQYWESEKRKN